MHYYYALYALLLCGTMCESSEGPPMSLVHPSIHIIESLIFWPRNKYMLGSDAKFEISGVLHDGMDGCWYW